MNSDQPLPPQRDLKAVIDLNGLGVTPMHIQGGYTGQPKPTGPIAERKSPPKSPPPPPKKKD